MTSHGAPGCHGKTTPNSLIPNTSPVVSEKNDVVTMREILQNPVFLGNMLLLSLLGLYASTVSRDSRLPGIRTGYALLAVLFAQSVTIAFFDHNAVISWVFPSAMALLSVHWLGNFKQARSSVLRGFALLGLGGASLVLLLLPGTAPMVKLVLPAAAWTVFGLLSRLASPADPSAEDISRKAAAAMTISALIIHGLIAFTALRLGRTPVFLPQLFVLIPVLLLRLYDQHRRDEDTEHISQLNFDLETIQGIISKLGQLVLDGDQARQINKEILDAAAINAGADASALMLVEDARQFIMRVEAVRGEFPVITEFTVAGKSQRNSEVYEADDIYRIADGPLKDVFLSGQTVQKDGHGGSHDGDFTGHPLINSLMLCPILVSGKVYGIFLLARSRQLRRFSPKDYKAIRSFMDFASISIQNIQLFLESHETRKALSEAELAGEMQRLLMPKKIPSAEGLQISASTQAVEGIHSDYYDAVNGAAGTSAVILCDVAGRGMPSVLVMSMIRATFQLIAGSDRDAGSVLNWINRAVTRRIRLDRFANLIYLGFDAEKRELDYAGAAHQTVVIYRMEEGIIQTLRSEAPPIGIDPRSAYESKKVPVESGDIILLYTDGLIETRNSQGIQFGYKNLVRCLISHHSLDAESIRNYLLEEVSGFQQDAEQFDDRSLVVVKIA